MNVVVCYHLWNFRRGAIPSSEIPGRCDELQGNCLQEGFVSNILPPDKRNQHTSTHVQCLVIRSRFGDQKTDALLISAMLSWILYILSENVIHREPQACLKVCGRPSGRENDVSCNIQNKCIFMCCERPDWLEKKCVLGLCLAGQNQTGKTVTHGLSDTCVSDT